MTNNAAVSRIICFVLLLNMGVISIFNFQHIFHIAAIGSVIIDSQHSHVTQEIHGTDAYVRNLESQTLFQVGNELLSVLRLDELYAVILNNLRSLCLEHALAYCYEDDDDDVDADKLDNRSSVELSKLVNAQ